MNWLLILVVLLVAGNIVWGFFRGFPACGLFNGCLDTDSGFLLRLQRRMLQTG